PKSASIEQYFSTENELEYENFYADFTPLNPAMKFIFVTMIRKKIIHFTSSSQRRQINAAYLVRCYMVTY
ncbi:dual specificity protein phosphatase CDC14B-like isoform X3, partial [Leptotrombidium deliense]